MRKRRNTKERIEAANRIREIRQGAHMTQEKFAEILDISVSACKKIESGENQISVEVLRKVGKTFNVSLDYILLGEQSCIEATWKQILNCTETDKMRLMFRLWEYFANLKEEKYANKKDFEMADEKILEVFQKLQFGEHVG